MKAITPPPLPLRGGRGVRVGLGVRVGWVFVGVGVGACVVGGGSVLVGNVVSVGGMGEGVEDGWTRVAVRVGEAAIVAGVVAKGVFGVQQTRRKISKTKNKNNTFRYIIASIRYY